MLEMRKLRHKAKRHFLQKSRTWKSPAWTIDCQFDLRVSDTPGKLGGVGEVQAEKRDHGFLAR